ncbi:MAG: hypothetical protein ACEQR8_08180 [Cypionkella sp.]
MALAACRLSAALALAAGLGAPVPAPAQVYVPPIESRSAEVVTVTAVPLEQLVGRIAAKCFDLGRQVSRLTADEVVCDDEPDHASHLAFMTVRPRPGSPLKGYLQFRLSQRDEGVRVSGLRYAEYAALGSRKVRLISEERDDLRAILGALSSSR